MKQNKIFPQKLPPKFHGQIKPKKFVPPTHSSQTTQPQNLNKPQYEKFKLTLNGWKKKPLDKDIIAENNDILLSSTKISYQNPQWCKTTYFYHKKSLQKRKQNDESKNYNIFGDQKQITRRSLFPRFDRAPLKLEWPQSFMQNTVRSRLKFSNTDFTQKIGIRNRNIQSHYQIKQKQEVCPKIGFLETRTFDKRNTQIKIGHNLIIDTNKIA